MALEMTLNAGPELRQRPEIGLELHFRVSYDYNAKTKPFKIRGVIIPAAKYKIHLRVGENPKTLKFAGSFRQPVTDDFISEEKTIKIIERYMKTKNLNHPYIVFDENNKPLFGDEHTVI